MFIFLKDILIDFYRETKKWGKDSYFFFFSNFLWEKKKLIAILYRISLYYILDKLPLQLKNVCYTNIYVQIQLEYLALKKKNSIINASLPL